MTVSAPRNRIMWAISRSVREAKESMTSMAVTSTMTPRERNLTTCCTRALRSWLRSASERAAWNVAMRTAPCLRIGTSTLPFSPGWLAGFCQRCYFVPQEALGLFDTALQIADRVHFAEVHADGDQSLSNLRRQASDDDGCAKQARGFDRLHQVVRDGNVHSRHARDIDDNDLRAIRANPAEQLFGQLACALRVDDADDWENEEPLTNLQDRRREFTNGFLLLTNDSLAFLNETDRHRVGDAICRWFVGVQDAVEFLEIRLVLCKEGAGKHVAEEQNDSNDFVRFNASRDDAFGQVSRISLQSLEGLGLESFHVAVIHGRGFCEDFFLGHGRQQSRFRNAADPLFAKLSSVLAEVCHQLSKQLRRFVSLGHKIPLLA